MDGYQRMAELLAPSHSSPSLVPSLSTYNKENKKWAPTLAIIGDKHSTKITIIIIIPTKLLDRKKNLLQKENRPSPNQKLSSSAKKRTRINNSSHWLE